MASLPYRLRRRATALARLLLALSCAGGLAAAQFEDGQLAPVNTRPGRSFGSDVKIEGDRAVIGAPGSLSASVAGAVLVYAHNGTDWIEEQDLQASDGHAGDYFGLMVALSGDTLLVGSLTGKAYVFQYDGVQWLEQAVLTRPGLGSAEHFGVGVWLDGNTAVVSAMREGTAGADSGAAYVFVRNAGVWSFQQRLAPSDAAGNDLAGFSAIQGDTLLLGAPGKDGQRGAVYVFTRSGTTWTQRQKLTASDGQIIEGFGSRLSLEGDVAVITSQFGRGVEPRTGAAYVFARSGGSWSEQQKLSACDGAFFDLFGSWVALSGDALLIGAAWDQDHGSYSGSTYLFRRRGASWVQAQKLVSKETTHDNYVGRPALWNDRILIGAPGHDGDGAEAGRVCVYHLSPSLVSHFNGSGLNANRLTAGDTDLGQSWNATLEVRGFHAPGAALLLFSTACSSGYPVRGGFGEGLLGGVRLHALGPVPHAGAGSTASFAAAVPADPALVGLRWVVQAAVSGGTLGLSSAATGIVR